MRIRCIVCGAFSWPWVKGCRPCQEKLARAMWAKLMESVMAGATVRPGLDRAEQDARFKRALMGKGPVN